jgi:Protein of unknown function (DUF3306)
MAADREDFLRRWSRRKRDAESEPTAAKPVAADPAPKLPAIDSLNFESDFKVFMHAKVEESVKRAALKKLFSDPRFNVIDFMDVYIDDYSKENPIPPAMLADLQHSRSTLFGREQEKPEEKREEQAAPEAGMPDVAQAPDEESNKEDDGAAG